MPSVHLARLRSILAAALLAIFALTILGGGNIGAQVDPPAITAPGGDTGGLRGVQIPATPSPLPNESNVQPLTLIAPAAGGLQTDPANLTFTWTPHPRARWYRLRVENGAGKALLVRRFDDPAAICTESLCTVQVTDADGALKDGRRYRWLVAAKVQGREELRRSGKMRFTAAFSQG